jgi:hypothetical protein
MLKPIGEPAGFRHNQLLQKQEAIGADLEQKSFTLLNILSGGITMFKNDIA